ncbi:MAG: HlyD family efflux transporter periplasmic adaptor subunit [Nitrospinota bacterium]|nr:HlyD family efflux transporter periplasmic adaptor subunit [Nitrospinota bacterium]
MSRQRWFILASIIVLASSFFLFKKLIKNEPIPKKKNSKVLGSLVKTFEVEKKNRIFWVSGFGTVKPKTEIKIIPEVSGRVIFRSKKFRKGAFVKKGQLLFQVDPVSYNLSVRQKRAEIGKLKSDIKHLIQSKNNFQADLDIAIRHLNVIKKELDRKRKIRQKQVISQQQFERVVESYLRQERVVQSVKNSLALIPSKLEQKRKSVDIVRVELDRSLIDLKKTKFYAPFDSRVSQAEVEVGDYLQQGNLYGRIYETSSVEISVSIPVEEARWVFPKLRFKNLEDSKKNDKKVFPFAEIKWNKFGKSFKWKGRVSRVDAGLDSSTRTLSLIVEVVNTSEILSGHPVTPLTVGMFVSVRIKGILVSQVYALPRFAVRSLTIKGKLSNTVFLYRNAKLKIKSVDILRKTMNQVFVKKGLQDGDKVIVSPLPDAVDGMKLRNIQSGDKRKS